MVSVIAFLIGATYSLKPENEHEICLHDLYTNDRRMQQGNVTITYYPQTYCTKWKGSQRETVKYAKEIILSIHNKVVSSLEKHLLNLFSI